MKVLIVSGIWPPDVGGPASHAPEVAEFLVRNGHQPRVLVTAAAAPDEAAYPIDWVSRSLPPGVLHLRAVARIARLARAVDVVYTTGMFGRSGAGSLLAHTPYVTKLTADPAFERARRRGLHPGSLAEFQNQHSLSTLPLRLMRDQVACRAAHIVCPSSYLRELAIGWGVLADGVDVLPNPAPDVAGVPARDELRARWHLHGPTLVFVGRLTAQKSLPLAIAAAAAAGVDLVIAGDGPDRASLEQLGHARFVGALSRADVLGLLRAADASILSSGWENFPHSVVEALAVGTPMIATAVGGVAEVVHDGENGLLVAPGDVEALSAAVRRAFSEPGLLDRLRARAADSVASYAPERVYGQLLQILERAA